MNKMVHELALKTVESLSDDERQMLVSRIEGMKEILVSRLSNEKLYEV